jgi:hypothetical protein
LSVKKSNPSKAKSSTIVNVISSTKKKLKKTPKKSCQTISSNISSAAIIDVESTVPPDRDI